MWQWIVFLAEIGLAGIGAVMLVFFGAFVFCTVIMLSEVWWPSDAEKS